ncbi:MAG: pyrroline-5-carboxylate reductase, partial [Endomicrobia bacterium]|nr:pyrroline-5-carboxylate reductase [Endomicrobiia bacterium]
IGCGNMGEVVVSCAVSVVNNKNVFCYDIDKKKLRSIKKKYNVNISYSNSQLVQDSDVIVLAVKPQQIKEVLLEIRDFVTPQKVIISIAAGIKIKFIEKILSSKTQILRTMPNLPLKVGYGVTAICKNNFCKNENCDFAKKIFSNKGIVIEVKENKIDLITAISGSGPAYIFYISEVIQKIARSFNLPKKIVPEVVNYTILGAAEMLVQSKLSAEELRQAVTSKGGTTEQALKVFYKHKLDKIFNEAIKKAYTRAKKLSEN